MSKRLSKCPFHSTENIREFDALDEKARANPWPYYDWLREDETRAIYKLPQEKSFYVVHRYEDVKNILADNENFSSKIIPVVKSPFFVLDDGEEHKRIRSIVGEVLSQKNILLMENQITEIIRKATGQLLNGGEQELFSTWADKIPLQILSFVFGMKYDDSAVNKLHNDTIAINRALFVTGGTGPRRENNPTAKEKFFISIALLKNSRKILQLRKIIGANGMRELGLMLNPIERNTDIPRPDFKAIPTAIAPLLDLMIHFAKILKSENIDHNNPLSILKNAIASQNASLAEMVMAGAFILFAGYETTSSLLSNSFVHLARNPDIFQNLKNNPEKLENFVEESLRFYTPVGRFLRKANKDVEVNGTILPKDSIIILMTGAANTDPLKFENGCTFDIERNNNRQHLSFGKGVHYCIGAPLARLQISIALNELIKNADSLNMNKSKPLHMVVDRDNGILRFEEIWVQVKEGATKERFSQDL